MIGCMLEGKVSCAAAVHLASAYSCITRIDLDGPVLCSTDPVKGGPIFDGGPKISLTEDPGSVETFSVCSGPSVDPSF